MAVIFTYNYCIIAEYKIDSTESEIIQVILANFKITENIMLILHPGSQYNLDN